MGGCTGQTTTAGKSAVVVTQGSVELPGGVCRYIWKAGTTCSMKSSNERFFSSWDRLLSDQGRHHDVASVRHCTSPSCVVALKECSHGRNHFAKVLAAVDCGQATFEAVELERVPTR